LLRCLKIRSWFSLRSLWSVVKCVQVSCDTNNFFDCAASSKEPWPWREPYSSRIFHARFVIDIPFTIAR
jgi:hypothetical protein